MEIILVSKTQCGVIQILGKIGTILLVRVVYFWCFFSVVKFDSKERQGQMLPDRWDG